MPRLVRQAKRKKKSKQNLLFLKASADSEDMPVRMPHVHLTNVPFHVRRRPGDVETLIQATLVNGVYIVHPSRHPYAFVGAFVAGRTKRHRVIARAPTTLAAFTQKDLTLTGADSSKCRR